MDEPLLLPVMLHTERLLLRPFRRDDIPALLPLIGAREVAATTLRIPHPYTCEDAEKYLDRVESVWAKREGARASASSFAMANDFAEGSDSTLVPSTIMPNSATGLAFHSGAKGIAPRGRGKL